MPSLVTYPYSFPSHLTNHPRHFFTMMEDFQVFSFCSIHSLAGVFKQHFCGMRHISILRLKGSFPSSLQLTDVSSLSWFSIYIYLFIYL